MSKSGEKSSFPIIPIPFVEYSYYSCLLAFAFLGIANTILQVSLNPLLSNVVRNDQLTTALTAGQMDVGINTITPRILMERCSISVEEANYGVSVYFACRTAGAFTGAFILSRFSATQFFRTGMIVAVAAAIILLCGLYLLACSFHPASASRPGAK